MAKLRLQFAKEGRAVYMSHLDLLRTFQRIFFRQGLALRHSQGYHPHPLLSFALPLPVGQSSACELLDFDTESPVEPAGLAEKLMPFAPEGIRPIRCYEPFHPVGELERLRCWVELQYDNGVPAGAAEAVQALLTGETILISKKTKHRDSAIVDIRPLIYALSVDARENTICLETVVAAQNPGLNPALLAAAVEKYCPNYRPDFARAGRLEFLTRTGEHFS